MTAEQRKRVPLLLGLLAMLAVVIYWQAGGDRAVPVTAPVRPVARGARPQRAPAEVLAQGVGLERLEEDRPAPGDGGRDPFRTGAAAAASGEGAGVARPAPLPSPPMVSGPVVAPGPPPLAPIVVKFIGVVSRQDVGRVAVLSDGRNVYYGREGEIVDGRWRIVTIGEESLQIEYADGRGRQTVRLTG